MTRENDSRNEDKHCYFERNLKLLQGKYAGPLLCNLFQGTRRFGELRRSIPGISAKTLADKLRFYTEQGIITRISYNERPLKVEYRLTEKGMRLKRVLDQLDSIDPQATIKASGSGLPKHLKGTLTLNSTVTGG